MSNAEDAGVEEGVGFYNRDLIDLAARAGDAHNIAHATHRATARSPICGSVVDVELALDAGNRVLDFGYNLQACALTKSVVAVMRDAVIGCDRATISAAHAALQKLLAGDSDVVWPTPAWAQMAILAPLKDYAVRHNAMQLPFEAAEKAFDNRVI